MTKELHSSIGASGAYRWINCPGSVRLSESLPKTSSSYASLGTAAHELAETCLLSGGRAADRIGETIIADGSPFIVDDSMANGVQIYLDTIRGDLSAHGGELVVEQSFDLSWIAPGMFGRNDASIIPVRPFGTLRVYDYKNGRKAVYAFENEQTMYYGLGALGERNLMFAETLVCTIVQPNSWEKNPVDSFEIRVPKLYEWAYDVLRPAAKLVNTPDAPLAVGAWCEHCRAAGVCPARRNEAIAALNFPELPEDVAVLPAPKELTPEEIGKLSSFFGASAFTAWVKAIQEEEKDMLARGVLIPGKKLVETEVKGDRKWADEKKVAEALSFLGDELYVAKLIGITRAEALLTAHGKSKKEREEVMSALTERPLSVKSVVVSEADSRSAISRDVNFTKI